MCSPTILLNPTAAIPVPSVKSSQQNQTKEVLITRRSNRNSISLNDIGIAGIYDDKKDH